MSYSKHISHYPDRKQISVQTLKEFRHNPSYQDRITPISNNYEQSGAYQPHTLPNPDHQKLKQRVVELEVITAEQDVMLSSFEMRLRALEWNPRGKGGPEFEKVFEEEIKEGIIMD